MILKRKSFTYIFVYGICILVLVYMYSETSEESNFHFKFLPWHIIGVYGVILHALLFIAFVKDPLKCFRSSATYLVANLAISDFIISLCGPFEAWFRHWSLLNTTNTAFSVSMLTIVSIAADRWLMVVSPFKHHYLMNGKRVLVWITCVWISSILYALKYSVLEAKNIYNFSVEVYLGVAIVLAVGILYLSTSISMRKQRRKLALQNESVLNRSETTRLLKEKQFMKTILLVAFVTFSGLIPVFILHYVLITKEVQYQEMLALDILWCFFSSLFFFTFATNPLIYFLRLPKYQKTFYILYWKRT